MALESERSVYEQRLAEWLAAGFAGRWVVIHGQDVVGFFDDLDAAAGAGYEQFGVNELFLVRQVAQQQAPIHASRRAVHADRQPGD